ncbi:MAG: winged helix DNA-binding domain-containing protein [Solirubrobacteraceae bacterium]
MRRLLAVQAQDRRAAGLAVRARCRRATSATLEHAVASERALVVSWLLRGTLHLVCRDDYPWLLGLSAPTRSAASRRRLAQEGVSPAQSERAVALIAASLADSGPLTRTELARRLEAAGIPTAGQAIVHLLMLTALRGVAVVGPRAETELSLALSADWLGRPAPAELAGEYRDRALTELARRYLAGHGPATAADLASWAGLPLRDARRGLGSLGGSLAEVGGGLLDLRDRGADGRRPPPARLLPAFDPYMLGWKDRGFAVRPEDRRRVHPGGGLLRAVATGDGLVVGTWGVRRRGGRLRVTVEAFAELGDDLRRDFECEAVDLARFEGLTPDEPVVVVEGAGQDA